MRISWRTKMVHSPKSPKARRKETTSYRQKLAPEALETARLLKELIETARGKRKPAGDGNRAVLTVQSKTAGGVVLQVDLKGKTQDALWAEIEKYLRLYGRVEKTAQPGGYVIRRPFPEKTIGWPVRVERQQNHYTAWLSDEEIPEVRIDPRTKRPIMEQFTDYWEFHFWYFLKTGRRLVDLMAATQLAYLEGFRARRELMECEIEFLEKNRAQRQRLKFNRVHMEVLETAYGRGLEKLTQEERAQFLDDYCPFSDVREHSEHSIRTTDRLWCAIKNLPKATTLLEALEAAPTAKKAEGPAHPAR